MVEYTQSVKPRKVRAKPKTNRVTQSIKENVVLTFEMLGGVHRYAEWADKNPDRFYDHWIKMLPAEIKAEVSVTHDFTGILERARGRVSERLETANPRSLEAIADEVRVQVFNTAGELVDNQVRPEGEGHG